MPFEGLLGNSCELKIIEYLLPLRGMEFNLTELAREVNISRPTADRIVKKFVNWGLMDVTSVYGKTKYYALNENSGFIDVFENLNNRLVEHILGEENLYEVGDYLMQHAPVCSPKPITLSEEVASWVPSISKRQSEPVDGIFIKEVQDFPNDIIAMGGINAA